MAMDTTAVEEICVGQEMLVFLVSLVLITIKLQSKACCLHNPNIRDQERAQHLLTETKSILKGLGKGGLPLIPEANDLNFPPPVRPLPQSH